MNGLDLFAGSGIGSLAFKYTIPNYRTVCYVENDPYCQAVLVARIKDGLLEDAPIWDDVRTFDGSIWRGKVDIVSGGFPCQPFSVAGQRKGDADERNLWPDTARIIGEVRPRYAFLENVSGLISSGYFETILCDLAKIGYDIEWDVVGASDVGANHRRKRLWILAYSGSPRTWNLSREVRTDRGRSGRRDESTLRQTHTENGTDRIKSTGETEGYVADTINKGLQGRDSGKLQECTSKQFIGESNTLADAKGRRLEKRPPKKAIRHNAECGSIQTRRADGWWSKDPAERSAQSSMGRVAHGVAFRVDKLKMLGNGWVPWVVARILKVGSE